MKLTPWFPASVRPARPGVYQTYSPYLKECFYNLWDGKRWYLGYYDLKISYCWDVDPMYDEAQDLKRWRGLAKEPA